MLKRGQTICNPGQRTRTPDLLHTKHAGR